MMFPSQNSLLSCLLCCFHILISHCTGAQPTPYELANPMIGTDYSEVFTKWGNEGGTYPGAVAPFGKIQLTPETGSREPNGYHYKDSRIFYFTCTLHHSGYPRGSSGALQIMPLPDTTHFVAGKTSWSFSHQEETAHPGYYQVLLLEPHINIEATATPHAGMLRLTFPVGTTPAIYVGDVDEMAAMDHHTLHGERFHTVIHFSRKFEHRSNVEGGAVYTFSPSGKRAQEIIISLSTSTVDHRGSQLNIDRELGKYTFDQVREQSKNTWEQMLSVISVEDINQEHKEIFYSALYHSLLMPWILSDVDGKYRGSDGQVHKASGRHAYGGFSPWDTYRTQHPLLTLLFPDVQEDMVHSMLDLFKQTGALPVDPMTGNHAVPIVVDSYIKGIPVDSLLAFQAMMESIEQPPFIRKELADYHRIGYLSADYSESVTKTVEYAYDDWALAQYAKNIMKDDSTYAQSMERSFAYRKLFNPSSLFIEPLNGTLFMENPGTFGYKEGDHWVYSYAIPFQPRDLINLMGGNHYFSERLDRALEGRDLVFDNETVLHVPYLFTYANRSDLTQKWVRQIMEERFAATPSGLPGNDDLGSMSSWFVFSALGFYPTTPGRPVYDFGSPLFYSATLHLPNGNDFKITTKTNSIENTFVQSIRLNQKNQENYWITHQDILAGGELEFTLSSVPGPKIPEAGNPVMLTEVHEKPVFKLVDLSVSEKEVKPNEAFWIKYTVENTGSAGTKILILSVNGKPYSHKNCLVPARSSTRDSIACRLYTTGTVKLAIDQIPLPEVMVKAPEESMDHQFQVFNVVTRPVLPQGEKQRVSYTIKNIGWEKNTFSVPFYLEDSLSFSEDILLEAGEMKQITTPVEVSGPGLWHLQVSRVTQLFKVYENPEQALVLDLPIGNSYSQQFRDLSGFHNDGQLLNEKRLPPPDGRGLFDGRTFIEVPASQSLTAFDSTITLMMWVKAASRKTGYTDLITRGDHHVMQIVDGKHLNFFAGGWGRGECSAELPENWVDTWHHVAGVCDGHNLKLYLDGELIATTLLAQPEDLSAPGIWAIGSNEEFPGERLFEGTLNLIKIYASALSDVAVRAIYQKEKVYIHQHTQE